MVDKSKREHDIRRTSLSETQPLGVCPAQGRRWISEIDHERQNRIALKTRAVIVSLHSRVVGIDRYDLCTRLRCHGAVHTRVGAKIPYRSRLHALQHLT